MIKIKFYTDNNKLNYSIEKIENKENKYYYYLNDKKVNNILGLRNYLRKNHNFLLSELLYNINDFL